MTRGVLIFAFNNEHIDYVKMAAWCASNVHRHLDVPVAVVTDSETAHQFKEFDKVIYSEPVHSNNSRWFSDFEKHVAWKNSNRTDAYSLSPWDQTLVLDSDYVVASDQLLQLFDCEQSFLCHRTAISMGGQEPSLHTFGDQKFPMWWATVMMFRRSTSAKFIFESMHMVRENWQHFRDLYNIRQTTYRNDYALSIALALVSGHTLQVDNIPWPLINCLPEYKLTQFDQDSYEIKWQAGDGKPYHMCFSGLDFHAMGKRDLGAIINGAG